MDRFRILDRFIDNYQQNCLSEQSGISTSHRSSEWWFNVPLSAKWFKFLDFPQTNHEHGTNYLWTMNASQAPHEVYLSTSIFRFASMTSVHLREHRHPSLFGIWMSGFWLAGFNYGRLINVQGVAICIIWCTVFCWASSTSVWIACIKLFTAECTGCAAWFPLQDHHVDLYVHLKFAISFNHTCHSKC